MRLDFIVSFAVKPMRMNIILPKHSFAYPDVRELLGDAHSGLDFQAILVQDEPGSKESGVDVVHYIRSTSAVRQLHRNMQETPLGTPGHM